MKERLKKEVEHEIQWLRYYGLREDREKLDLSKSIYEQVRSIGYTKRVVPLDLRCIGCLSYQWKEGLTVENLEPLNERRNGIDRFTPLEMWVKLAKVILGDYRPFSFDEISRILSKREFKGVDHHEER